MKKWILPLAAVSLIILALWAGLFGEKLDVLAPDAIELQQGEPFCVDDYVEVRGRKKDVILKYRDDININIPGTYTLNISAENKKGERAEKTVKVTVVARDSEI